ncbi:hypothetical protein [Brevibacillus sp. DP1.3A]|uniref:hypothetical protein n=1 Tax=Brevibacillus sp. DP1.3A TaxID=2738867 RepID=UPI00156B3D9C|nr:hypothetical protein [Brevibacillus sp. DP1.3A]UED78099.1 hypothetical protein HP399_030710 [Brevibacillus sp. DP1.3A]
MTTYNLLLVEDRLYIHMGCDEQDPLYQYAYDGLPNRIEIGEAEIVGTVELTPEQLEKIQAEYENGGECGWCGEIAKNLRPSHMFDFAPGKKMCKNCWNHDRGVYLGSYGEDIGPFDEKDDSKQCVACKNFIDGKRLLKLDDENFECEDCAQHMSDMAP